MASSNSNQKPSPWASPAQLRALKDDLTREPSPPPPPPSLPKPKGRVDLRPVERKLAAAEPSNTVDSEEDSSTSNLPSPPTPNEETRLATLMPAGWTIAPRWSDIIELAEETSALAPSSLKELTGHMALTPDERKLTKSSDMVDSPEATEHPGLEHTELHHPDRATGKHQTSATGAAARGKPMTYSCVVRQGLPETVSPPVTGSSPQKPRSILKDSQSRCLGLSSPKPSSRGVDPAVYQHVLSSTTLWGVSYRDPDRQSSELNKPAAEDGNHWSCTQELVQNSYILGLLRNARTSDKIFWRARYMYLDKRLHVLESQKATCVNALEANRQELREHSTQSPRCGEDLRALEEEISAYERKLQSLTDTITKLEASATTAGAIMADLAKQARTLARTHKLLMQRLASLSSYSDALKLEIFLRDCLKKLKTWEGEFERKYNVDCLKEDLEARYWANFSGDPQYDWDDSGDPGDF